MRALIYKEWLKLKWSWLLILAANLLVCGYLVLDLGHEFRVEHAEMIYYQASRVGRLFYDDLRYLPLVSGLGLAAAQFIPEVLMGRLRLAMHLPIRIDPLILAHIAIGLVALGLVLVVTLAGLALAVGRYFPAEFVTSALITALPWALAGVAGYLGLTLALLEPRRRYQVVNLLVMAGVVGLCHQSRQAGAYGQAMWGLLPPIGLTALAVLVPARRFRDGGR